MGFNADKQIAKTGNAGQCDMAREYRAPQARTYNQKLDRS